MAIDVNPTVLISPERTQIERIIAVTLIDCDVDMDAKERVAAGAALLDREYPGWANNINLSRFDLSNGAFCVLGQVYGGYETGLKNIWGRASDSNAASSQHGFYDHAGNYTQMQKAWKVVIKQRQKKSKK